MLRVTFAVCVLAACGDTGGFPDAAVPDAAPTGTFSLMWSVIDQDSAPLACSRISGQTMTMLAHNKAFSGGETQIFTCDGAMGQTQAMIAGTYDLGFELHGTSGVLATAPQRMNVELAPNTNTPLTPPVVFQVEALGDVAFQLAAIGVTGNCAAAPGGAGIETMTIALTRNSDGACEPITLAISGGGTYTVNCTSPVEVACIESDQVLTASDISSDGYTIRVRGNTSTADNCWINNDTIQVPPLGLTLTRTLNLAFDTAAPGCS